MSDQTETGQRVLQPPSWPRPRGYANGIVAGGETIFLAGQVGWDAQGRFPKVWPTRCARHLPTS